LAFGFGDSAGELAEDVCASPARGETHAQISVRAQAAPNHFRMLHERFRLGSKGNPSKLKMRAAPRFGQPNVCSTKGLLKNKRPNWDRHCHHPPLQEAMPVLVGLIQVTEVFRP
jgi:hypothetical protein